MGCGVWGVRCGVWGLSSHLNQRCLELLLAHARDHAVESGGNGLWGGRGGWVRRERMREGRGVGGGYIMRDLLFD